MRNLRIAAQQSTARWSAQPRAESANCLNPRPLRTLSSSARRWIAVCRCAHSWWRPPRTPRRTHRPGWMVPAELPRRQARILARPRWRRR